MIKYTHALLLMFLMAVSAYAAEPFGTGLGSFNGVTAYSNGSPSNVSNSYNKSSGLTTGMKWQCVEFVRRYYLEVFKIDLRSFYSGNANTWYDNASAMGLTRYANGAGNRPQIGDVMVSAGGPYGHVAIVSSVSNSQVCVVEQNFHNDSRDADGSHCMSMTSGGSVDGFSSDYPIQGWLRPRCDPTSRKCNIARVGSVGWFPPISDCRNASQWFIMGIDSGDNPYSMGSRPDNSACPTNACSMSN